MGLCASIKDLTFSYENVPQLKHIDLEFNDGDFVIITGLTGSGKTTLLRHLTMDKVPNGHREGSISLWSESVGTLHHKKLDSWISYLPQRPRESLSAGTLRQELNLRLFNDAHQQLSANDIVSFLGISHLLDIPVDQLSEGQAQLVAFCAALSTHPRLLLLDEPTASLDTITRRTTFDLLRRLQEDIGLTIVMTEHNLDGCCVNATRLVALDHGVILANDQPAQALVTLWNHSSSEIRALIPQEQSCLLLMDHDQHIGHDVSLPLTHEQGHAYISQYANHYIPAVQKAYPSLHDIMPSTRGDSLALSVSNISYAYKHASSFVVHDISLTADYGQIVMLMGQSGSGKSTILDLLSGLLKPQFGSIRWHPRDKRRTVPPSKSFSFVSYLPQDVRPILNLSAGEIFATSSLQNTDFHDPLDQSIGQQQLEALHLIVRQQKPVLLLDEPTQGLDAIAITEVGQTLQDLALQGYCIIVSTHDQEFCATWGTRMMVILSGEIIADGDPRSLIGSQNFSTTPVHQLFNHYQTSLLTFSDLVSVHHAFYKEQE
ncbi:MAG: ATP-binding cassette domain-containing protein [Aeriscardovia sp.]|nr:ATP-binding cassette domain-containing protein [Aeriscardovia sp.]